MDLADVAQWAPAFWAVVGAVVAAFVIGMAQKFGERFAERIPLRLRAVFQRPPRRLTDHFREMPTQRLDLVVFTITVRAELPITDALYLEFLRSLLINDKAERVVVIAWNPDSRAADEAYRAMLNQMFGEWPNRFRCVDGEDEVLQEGFAVPQLFFDSLKCLSGEQYQKWMREFGLRGRSLQSMNRARPASTVLSGVVGHALRNSFTVPGLLDELRGSRAKTAAPSVGVLFWELELDRLAVFHQLAIANSTDDRKGFELVPLIGRTIRSSFVRAGDNHGSGRVNVLEHPRRQLAEIKRKSRREVVAYVRAITAILLDNYGIVTTSDSLLNRGRQAVASWRVSAPSHRWPRLSRPDYRLIALLVDFRKQLGRA